MVRGPTSSMNSSEPTTKRPSASICQTKRNGWRRSAIGHAVTRSGGKAAFAAVAAGGRYWCWRLRASAQLAPARFLAAALSLATVSLGCGGSATTSTRESSLPRLVAVTSKSACRKRAAPLARPDSSALAASASRPSADNVVAPPSHVQRRRIGMKERAVGREMPRVLRRHRETGGGRARASGSDGPAGSVAATRTAAVLSGSTMREQAQISGRPKRAPKPRNRSSRSCPADGSVAASRTI